MSRQLLEKLTPEHWESGGQGQSQRGFQRMRWLQGVSDLFNRPVLNRMAAMTNATTLVTTGMAQSTGIGVGQVQPKRYGEFTIKARVTFNSNTTGSAYLYIFRTQALIPALGAAPNAGDVVVGGDAFASATMAPGVNEIGTFSFLDTGLDVTKLYRYYLAVLAPNASIVNIINASQILVMERS